MHAPTTRDRSFHGRLVRRHVGVTCQGDVAVLGTEFDLILAARDAVRKVRGTPRFDAHGVQFGHFFGLRQQQRHGAKRHAFVVEVEAGHNDAVALVG